MSVQQPEWLALLEQAVADEGDNKQAVADRLGVSRTAISLVLADKYPSRTDKFAKKVMDTLGRIACPHLATAITREQCRHFNERKAPTSSPREMRHWRACQSCIHKPRIEEINHV